MLQYLRELGPIFTILLGWLLGCLTPTIVERIRRPYRRRDSTLAVIDEMLGLQYTMVAVAYRIRGWRAEMSDAFLDEILPILERYRGPDRDEEYVEGIRKNRSLSQKERAATHRAMSIQKGGLALRQYSIPLLATQVADLAVCGLDFQRAVLNIRKHIDLFNQLGPYSQALFEKSFTNLSSDDRAALMANREQAYRDAGNRAEIIVRAISELQVRYGPAK